MADSTPKLGQIIGPDDRAFRDAVHVAVCPLTLGQDMSPGDHFALNDDGEAVNEGPFIGILDPYLCYAVIKKGQRVWGLLYPDTVTSLRHVWQHPAFRPKIPRPKEPDNV